MIIVFGIALICFIWAGLFYKIESEREMVIRDTIKEAGNLARAFEEHTIRTIKSADQTALFLKYQYEKEGTAIDMTPYKMGGSLWIQTFVLLSIADANGDLIASNQDPFVASNIGDREHFRIHRDDCDNQLFIGKPVLGRSSGKWSIQMTRRVNNPDGSFGGVVIISVDPFYFTSFYQQVDIGKHSVVALVGRDGVIRAWQSNEDVGVGRDLNQPGNNQLLKQLAAGLDAGHYVAISTVDGVKRVNSYRSLRDYPVIVNVGIAEAEALKDFYQRRDNYYVVAFLLSLFIAGALGLLTQMILARQRAERLQVALYQISETASSAHNLDELYRAVHKIIGELIPAQNFYIALYDEKKETLHFPYRVDEQDGNPGSRQMINGLPEYVIRTGKPLLLNERARADLEALGEIATIGARATHWLGVPLKTAAHKVFGVMTVLTYADNEKYTEKDQDVLTFVSNQVAMAIERKQAEEETRYLGMHDILTGFFNRAYFEEELKRFQDGRYMPITILMCDIDGLKLVNDTFGHDAGDQLLIATSRLIRHAVRQGDVAARIGGDEFAIILPRADELIAQSICKRIRTQIERYNESNGGVPVSVSLGYAVKRDKGVTMQDLLKDADNRMYREKLHHSQSARSAIVQTVMKLLEERDFDTEEHAERLQDMTTTLARRLKLVEPRIGDIRLLAKFHDIGKIGIPDHILLKPGPLTEEERKEMRRHCEIGYRIAQSSGDLLPIADWILKHQEWYNGGGYPLGLSGADIPLECRILAVCDAYDAMTSDRPYRKAISHEAAISELKRCAGAQFDPQLVETFIETFPDHV